ARIPGRVPDQVDRDVAHARDAGNGILDHVRELGRRRAIGRGQGHVHGDAAIVRDVDLVDEAELVDVGGGFGVVDGLQRRHDIVGHAGEFVGPQRRPGRRRGGRYGRFGARLFGLRLFGSRLGRARTGLGIADVVHVKKSWALPRAWTRRSTSSRVL